MSVFLNQYFFRVVINLFSSSQLLVIQAMYEWGIRGFLIDIPSLSPHTFMRG